MAKKLNYRKIEMDVLEQLYHERKEKRNKAYASRKRKTGIQLPAKNLYKNPDSTSCDKALLKAI